jgi:Glu-tRNA(Gln) amidotransferase subunit E-like FAD-binding protein
MSKEPVIQKSIMEQIFDEMFNNLKDVKEFNEETIQKLHQLIEDGDITKIDSITEALTYDLEEKDEDTGT